MNIEELIAGLPRDEMEAVGYLCNQYKGTEFEYDDLIDFYNLFIRVAANAKFKVQLASAYDENSISSALRSNVNQFYPKVRDVVVEKLYNGHLNLERISTEDIESIQTYINNIRDIINSSALEEQFKIRLLEKLETLQTELHKSIPNKDIMFSNITKFGILLGEFGKNTRPLFDNFEKLLDSARKLIESIWKINSDLPALSPDQQAKLLSLDHINSNKDS